MEKHMSHAHTTHTHTNTTTALDIQEVLSGAGGDQLHVLVADVLSLLIPSICLFWIVPLGAWDCHFGLGESFFLFRIMSGVCLNSMRVWESLGVGMEASRRVALSVWSSLWLCVSFGVGGLNRYPPMLCLVLPGSPFSMLGRLGRMCLLERASHSALQRRLRSG